MRNLVLAFVLSMLAVGAVACSGSGGEPACDSVTPATSIQMKDFAFEPACAGVSEGATITVTNEGEAIHSFTVKGTSVNQNIEAGQSAQVDLTGIAPGTYSVVCSYHPQMTGALKITS